MPDSRDPIFAKVRSARRRAITNQFLTSATVTLFIAMLVSLFAIASIAIVPLEEILKGVTSNPSAITPSQWNVGWIIGSVAIAMIAAGIHAYLTAPSSIDTATQIDQRFGLRERLSTTLALQASTQPTNDRATNDRATNDRATNDRRSAITQAMTDDASSRAEKLDIARKFPIALPRLSWMPLSLVPIVLVMLSVVQPATPNGTVINQADATEVRRVKAAAAELKKRIVAQKKKASEKGLKETQQLFEKMEMKLDKITKSESLNRKDALIQLNELKEQIQQRKDRIGSPDQMRRTLSQMKGLKGGRLKKSLSKFKKVNSPMLPRK